MLTTNQANLLGHIAAATEPVAVQALAFVRNEHDYEMGENAARASCKRMEGNGWITGSGVGRLRSYAITPVGVAALRDPTADNGAAASSAPPPEIEDSSPASSRNYVVLEEIQVAELVSLVEKDLFTESVVYVAVQTTAARNVEAALRHAAKANFEDGTPRLVAVSEKMWQVTPVEVKTARSVSIGGG